MQFLDLLILVDLQGPTILLLVQYKHLKIAQTCKQTVNGEEKDRKKLIFSAGQV